jgi:hypothetical protein
MPITLLSLLAQRKEIRPNLFLAQLIRRAPVMRRRAANRVDIDLRFGASCVLGAKPASFMFSIMSRRNGDIDLILRRNGGGNSPAAPPKDTIRPSLAGLARPKPLSA